MKKDIDVELLRSMLSYDLATGDFRWLVKASKNTIVGAIAGTHSYGRTAIRVLGEQYLAHRLAWKYVTGKWPIYHIDHKDGNPKNNAFDNLRDVPQRTNLENQRKAKKTNMCGFLGVRHHRSKFQAHITIQGKWRNLGVFNTPEEAHEAYLIAKRIHHAGCTI